ncbi:ATP-binding protein [Gracilibacillus marinus]|uniref:histidine kinase n=1 Tax=Gracilibacillus marinus TaxID=630535 RepID=A0ABV8VR38_9BACI
MSTNRTIPLQRYWTSRFLLTLIIGLIIVATVSALWIRHTTLENRLQVMEFMAEETARKMADLQEEELPPGMDIHRFLEGEGRFLDIEGKPTIYITNTDGMVIYENVREVLQNKQIEPSYLTEEDDVQEVNNGQTNSIYYVVRKPIEIDDAIVGYVFYVEQKDKLAKVEQAYGQLTIMILSLLVLGWIAIYVLARRLAKPIKEVADAAKQIEDGNYQVELFTDAKEEEVAMLIQSFKEMAQKLEKLETLRTELLAGVSHELKTPVTSISGLLGAIQDDVVEGEEAREFLNISIKETEKIKKMVDDLLAFNTFAANAVTVSLDSYLINELMKESIQLWEKTQGSQGIVITSQLLQEDKEVQVDYVRVQQIMMNLLHNANHATSTNGTVKIQLSLQNNFIQIDVADNGIGIKEEEQTYIFERFYRGENKKYSIGGLGLGLPFSKMIAQALGGDLLLVESSPNGTTFRLILPAETAK